MSIAALLEAAEFLDRRERGKDINPKLIVIKTRLKVQRKKKIQGMTSMPPLLPTNQPTIVFSPFIVV